MAFPANEGPYVFIWPSYSNSHLCIHCSWESYSLIYLPICYITLWSIRQMHHQTSRRVAVIWNWNGMDIHSSCYIQYSIDDLISDRQCRILMRNRVNRGINTFIWIYDILIDIMRHNLLLNVTSMSIIIAILSLPSYNYNQYATAAAADSSLEQHRSTRENRIQICCSWGN